MLLFNLSQIFNCIVRNNSPFQNLVVFLLHLRLRHLKTHHGWKSQRKLYSSSLANSNLLPPHLSALLFNRLSPESCHTGHGWHAGKVVSNPLHQMWIFPGTEDQHKEQNQDGQRHPDRYSNWNGDSKERSSLIPKTTMFTFLMFFF